MVIEWNEDYGKVLLRKDINTEPYEVIDIVDLLEAWERHKKAKCPFADPIPCEWIKCPNSTDCAWK